MNWYNSYNIPLSEGFDMSNMSDSDYTDTFADADNNAVRDAAVNAFIAACVEANDESVKLQSGKYCLAQIQFCSNAEKWKGFEYQGILRYPSDDRIVNIDEDGLRAITRAEYDTDGIQIIIDPEKVGQLPGRIYSLSLRIGSGIKFPIEWSSISLSGRDVGRKYALKLSVIPSSDGKLSCMPKRVVGNFILLASEGPVGLYRHPMKSYDGCLEYVAGNCTIEYGAWCKDPFPRDFTGCPKYVGGNFTVLLNPYNGADSFHKTFESGTGLPIEIGGHADLQYIRDLVKRSKNGGLISLCPDGMRRSWKSCTLFIPYNNYYEVRTNGK